uniref:CCDC144C domain-containing protein n=1 Tax=Rhabditophanes sp. KR3021 TaxID=114890 RepID=A0AC35TPJ5_9BILA
MNQSDVLISVSKESCQKILQLANKLKEAQLSLNHSVVPVVELDKDFHVELTANSLLDKDLECCRLQKLENSVLIRDLKKIALRKNKLEVRCGINETINNEMRKEIEELLHIAEDTMKMVQDVEGKRIEELTKWKSALDTLEADNGRLKQSLSESLETENDLKKKIAGTERQLASERSSNGILVIERDNLIRDKNLLNKKMEDVKLKAEHDVAEERRNVEKVYKSHEKAISHVNEAERNKIIDDFRAEIKKERDNHEKKMIKLAQEMDQVLNEADKKERELMKENSILRDTNNDLKHSLANVETYWKEKLTKTFMNANVEVLRDINRVNNSEVRLPSNFGRITSRASNYENSRPTSKQQSNHSEVGVNNSKINNYRNIVSQGAVPKRSSSARPINRRQ